MILMTRIYTISTILVDVRFVYQYAILGIRFIAIIITNIIVTIILIISCPHDIGKVGCGFAFIQLS